MFFDWSKVKEEDLWQYKNRVLYLQNKLDNWNKEFAETGDLSVSENQYMRVASELYYYWNESPYLSQIDKSRLKDSIFFQNS